MNVTKLLTVENMPYMNSVHNLSLFLMTSSNREKSNSLSLLQLIWSSPSISRALQIPLNHSSSIVHWSYPVLQISVIQGISSNTSFQLTCPIHFLLRYIFSGRRLMHSYLNPFGINIKTCSDFGQVSEPTLTCVLYSFLLEQVILVYNLVILL